MEININVGCPFCGQRHNLNIKTKELHPKEIAMCYVNYGGCGKHFAVFVDLVAEIKTAKIER